MIKDVKCLNCNHRFESSADNGDLKCPNCEKTERLAWTGSDKNPGHINEDY